MESSGQQQDPFALQRFIEAQSHVYEQVLAELAAGEKRSHWMWFIFPQLAGLGSSPMAQRFAISNLQEARAFLAHEVLGPRLRTCTALVNAVQGRTVSAIFGYPDDLKFCSSMTLFAEVDRGSASVFAEALAKYFEDKRDQATLQRLP